MPNSKIENAKIITENQLIKKYTITSLRFNQKTSSFSYDFPFEKVFDTFKEAENEIVLSLKLEANVWHTICPLYLPSELKEETNFAQCLHFDSVIKETLFKEKIEEDEEALIISVEETYRENGKEFPQDNSETKSFTKTI